MRKIRYQLKLRGQFLYYILFSKSHFESSALKRLKLAFNGGFTVDQYYLFDFKHNDRKEYLSEYDWFKSRMLNKPYDYMLNNKLVTSQMLKEIVKIPEVYAFKQNKKLKVGDLVEIQIHDIWQILLKKKSAIIKPIFAGKGAGIYKIEVDRDNAIHVNGEVTRPIQIEQLIRGKNNWLMCECIQQHSYAQAIYPGAVNTIRILVIKNYDNRREIVYAVHRFGTCNTGVVDNGSKGGIVAKVDLYTGELSVGRSMFNLEKYVKHPDTGKMILGTRIPKWEEIKQKIVAVSETFDDIKMIAWDVVLTKDEQVCIIEGNSSSGVNILQLWEGQRNMKFGQFLKNNNVIK